MKIKLIAISILVPALLLSCQKKGDEPKQSQHDRPPRQNYTAPEIHTAVVQEVIQVTSYTYLRVKENDTDLWVAIKKTPMELGETISYVNPLEMTNFTSKDLQRPFDKIFFIGAFKKGDASNSAIAAPAMRPAIDKKKILFQRHYYLFLVAYFVAITALLLIVAYVFHCKWVKKSPTRMVIVKFSTSVFSTLYILLALEGIFAYSFIQSDGMGVTLAHKRWRYKYWNPINSYGYRDYEPEWRGKFVFVVGDSFVAGNGIKKIDNRFSNILSGKLGNNSTVTILANPGWGPPQYINALANHNKTPDVIVISYYINDIQSAAENNGIKVPQLRYYPNKMVRPLIEHSYLINWAYYRLYRRNLASDIYWNYLKQAYSNDDVWKAHLQEIDALINYAKQVDAKIVFVIWPNLRDVSGSKDINSRVFDYLCNKGIMAIDLAKYFEKRDSSELVVNSIDAHPNEEINAEVAQLLYQALMPWD